VKITLAKGKTNENHLFGLRKPGAGGRGAAHQLCPPKGGRGTVTWVGDRKGMIILVNPKSMVEGGAVAKEVKKKENYDNVRTSRSRMTIRFSQPGRIGQGGERGSDLRRSTV